MEEKKTAAESFGGFVSELRKEKGMTQKQLAERLYVSDKAVSKWERGLSMPDVSLLIPLSAQLGVTVTELLEGRRMENHAEMDREQVETLLQKTIGLSEEKPRLSREKRRKNALIFMAAAMAAALEAAAYFLTGNQAAPLVESNVLLFALMALGFGVYFWFFMPERLPRYYDENKISAYSNGVVRFNMPGISFNNRNWGAIVKALRLWSVIVPVLFPLVWFALSRLAPQLWSAAGLYIELVLALGGLFVPVYAVGKKYG